MTTPSTTPQEATRRTETPILEARGLSRSFGHVRALNNAAFDIYPGEVVALIGDNGAGKSTMVKALTGNLELDSGELFFEGKPVTITSPEQATQMGMEVVYQDLALAPHLNPVQNMFLGREIPRKGILGRLGFMDEKAMRAKAKAGFDELGGTVRSYAAPVGSMSGGQRQQIAIVRAISWANKVVFLDEPTAALGVVQTKNVLDTIKRVRDKGIAVVLISHSMPDVLEVADRIQVMRLGTRVATLALRGHHGRRTGRRHDRRPGLQQGGTRMSVITPPRRCRGRRCTMRASNRCSSGSRACSRCGSSASCWSSWRSSPSRPAASSSPPATSR